MTIEFTVITGIVGIITAVLTFFIGRVSAAKKEGAVIAIMQSDIGHIKDSIAEIKSSLQEDLKQRDESIRRLHQRIDNIGVQFDDRIREHERQYHSA